VRQDDKVEPGVTALPADVHDRRVVRLGYGSVFASDKHSNPVLPVWLAGCLGRSRVNGKARRSMTSTRLLKRILEARWNKAGGGLRRRRRSNDLKCLIKWADENLSCADPISTLKH